MEKIINILNKGFIFLKNILSTVLSPLEGILNIFSIKAFGTAVIVVVFIGFLVYCIFRNRKQFLNHIKYTKTIVICSILIAVNLMLGHESVAINNEFGFSFGFITLPIIAALFGPLAGCFCGIIQDILSFFINSGGQNFHTTYILCTGISGMVLGLMLYRKKVTIWKSFLTFVTVILVVEVILKTIAISSSTGGSMLSIWPPRIINGAIQIPIQSGINYCILKIVEKIKF